MEDSIVEIDYATRLMVTVTLVTTRVLEPNRAGRVDKIMQAKS